jgi:hypothetical protein
VRILMLALAGCVTALGLGGCTEQAEPRPAPIVPRRWGGDSSQPGPMVVVCRPEDAGCVPTYAVACPAPVVADSIPGAQVGAQALSPEEDAWCAANAGQSSEARRK